MSRLSIAPPNHCSCTVNQARNLTDKSKSGGLSTFCTISMGKEKFVTAVCEKTSSPNWHEQCDMSIVDDATIKLTVYQNNKSSLSKGDFLGRAYVSLRDLQDYDRVQTNWHKLTNKDGKLDKDRGEIEVTLQFYSKNNTTGSVLDLATKKKHLSLKDIKHSLSDKLKTATKHRRSDKNGSQDQLADQNRRFGGDDGTSQNGRDFLNDSASETTSFGGSHMSLNSMANNNNVEQQKKKSRAPSSGLGSTMGTGTPYSSRRSETSEYDASSILDSASMYGADDHQKSQPPVQSQTQQQYREVYVGDDIPSKTNSSKKKTKEPAQSLPLPTIIMTKPTSSPPTDYREKFSFPNDDIKSNSKTSSNKSKEPEIISSPDSPFGLSTITESMTGSKYRDDEEINFDSYFNKNKQPQEEKKTKNPAPVIQQSKLTSHSKDQNRYDDIQTPSTSISVKTDNTPNSSVTLPGKKQDRTTSDDSDNSVDEDVDELLGKLERMSSMRSSGRRKIQPREDIMQQSYTEPAPSGQNQRQSSFGKTTLPDIVGEQTGKNSTQRPPVPSNAKKPATNGLNVLGYENVKESPINPKVRQELNYLDREELLHVIAYQTDLLKKKDTRVKDLEHYTDGLLVKIVEQCPAILQNGTIKSNIK